MNNSQIYTKKTMSIKNPNNLCIYVNAGVKHYGGSQEWYPTRKKKRSGCGPTNCSNLFWYLALSRKNCKSFLPHDSATKGNFLRLMNDVWHYVTPRRRGVDKLEIFIEGAEGYAKSKGISIKCRQLEIPVSKKKRPSNAEIFEFFESAFSDDLPVAFLNLSSGLAKNLDRWHWVTIVSANKMLGTVMTYDQGIKKEVNIAIWRNSTVLGGGFVAIEPIEEE